MANGTRNVIISISVGLATLFAGWLITWGATRTDVLDNKADIGALNVEVDDVESRQDRLEGRYDSDIPWIRDALGRIEKKLDKE